MTKTPKWLPDGSGIDPDSLPEGTYGYSEMGVGETRFGTFGALMRWMQ